MSGITIFSLLKLSKTAYFQGKLSGKRKTISAFFIGVSEVSGSLARDKKILQALIDTSKQSKALEIHRFQGFSCPERFTSFVNAARDTAGQKRTKKDRIIP